MQRTLLALTLAGSLLCNSQSAQAGADSTSFELSAYGTMLFEHYNFGADQKSFPDGAQPDSRSIVDINKVVFEAEYHFSPQTELEIELEIEHGGTGSAMELEYEEFGEYESEVEKGGEIILEDVYIKHKFDDTWSIKAGHFVIPIGHANRNTEPLGYFGVRQRESETMLLPASWHETGVEASATFGILQASVGVVNGLSSTGFSSRNWISGGHQTRFEYVQATDLAVYGYVSAEIISGLTLHASAYTGNTTNNRPKKDMEGISGQVLIVESAAEYYTEELSIRAGGMSGTLTNSDAISAKNQRLSSALEVPRTPVAECAVYMFVEAGYDISSLLGFESPLFVFAGFEHYNSMNSTVSGMTADNRFERNIYRFGLEYRASNDIALKADFKHREIGGGTYNAEQTVALGLCFDTHLFSL